MEDDMLAHSITAPQRRFAATEFMHDEGDEETSGCAPARTLPVEPATLRWVEEQEALAAAAARRATAGNRAHRAVERAPAPRVPRLGWLVRLETVLQRVLPANLGSLLSLFLCVSLAIMLMSAMLPIVDRI
jgi:hypothetical protein